MGYPFVEKCEVMDDDFKADLLSLTCTLNVMDIEVVIVSIMRQRFILHTVATITLFSLNY